MYVNEKLTQKVGKVIDDCPVSLPKRIPRIVVVGVAVYVLMWLRAMISRFGFR